VLAGEQAIKAYFRRSSPLWMPALLPQKINLWVRKNSVWVKLNVLMRFEPARGGKGWGTMRGNCIELFPFDDVTGNGCRVMTAPTVRPVAAKPTREL
jgi:hypothetical protein